jgi:hypothetical protein
MKALAVIILASALVSPLKAQDTTRVAANSTDTLAAPLYRNPKRALILGSVIPGSGHIYAGEYVHGFFAYEATVGGIGGGVLAFIWDRCALNSLSYIWPFGGQNPTTCKSGPQWPHQALGVALVGVGIWEWISSARDAAHAAERANAKHLRHRPTATPIVEAPADSHSGWRVGTEIRF